MKMKYILKVDHLTDDYYRIYEIPKGIYFQHKDKINSRLYGILCIHEAIKIMTIYGCFTRNYHTHPFYFDSKEAANKVFRTTKPQHFLIDQTKH